MSCDLPQRIKEENAGFCEELKLLEVQADCQLIVERSSRCSLLQEEVQGADFDTQQLLLKLQQSEHKVRVRLPDLVLLLLNLETPCFNNI